MERISILLVASFSFLCSYTQELIRYKFDHFTPRSGLSSIYARKIIKDPCGFIWIATIDGLNRYNGKSFTQYNKGLANNHSLTGSDIRDLLIDSASLSVWSVNSYGGLDQVDYITGNVIYRYFQNHDPQTKGLLFTSLALANQRLFIGSSKGIFTLDLKTKQVQKLLFQHPWKPGTELVINDLLIDQKGMLWVFCEGMGVCILDPNTNKVVDVSTFGYIEPGIRYYDVCQLADRSVLTATNTGLVKYSLGSRGQLVMNTNPFPDVLLGQENEVYACGQDSTGNIWFAQSSYLVKIDDKTRQPFVVKENISRAERDWVGSVYSIYFDAANMVWLGCQQGIAHAELRPAPFLRLTASEISEAKIGHAYYLEPVHDTLIYSCAQDGLYEVHTRSGVITPLCEKKPFYHFFIDPFGKKITANVDGSFVWQNNKLVPLAEIYPVFKPLGKIVINSHYQVHDSLIIMGTENFRGLIIWNFKKNTIINISSSTNGLHLHENTVNALFKDRSERLWILGDHSISLLDLKTFKLSWFLPQHEGGQIFFSIFFDVCEVGDKYYLASYGSGVLVLDSNLRVEKEITVAQGLSANSVYKILPWKDSLLFVTSNNGISLINLENFRISKYYESDGLHTNVFEENSGRIFNQVLYAGGEGGITRIDPALMLHKISPGKTYIDLIRTESATGSRDTSNRQMEKINIAANILQTTIYFSHTVFANSERNVFEYRIRELSDEWIKLGTQNFVSLIGLPPGTYHLEARAGREESNNSAATTHLVLKMLPKWYQTLLFKLLVLFTALALLYAAYRYRLLQIKKQQQIRKEIASDLHDDIGSTLNSVKIFTHLAKMEPQKDTYLTNIEDSLKQATLGLRDMIWILDDSRDTVSEMVERLKKYAYPVCQAKNIMFECHIETDRPYKSLTKTEKRNYLLIAKESINNSIKYSACNSIWLSIRQTRNNLSMTIKDDGKGFDPNSSLDGNGLKNIKYRAKQIESTASINSSREGTVILITKI